MKKLFKSIILSAALLTGAVAVAPSASAAWSGWQNESGYSGRVFTDATTYTAGASTIDWKAEKKGDSGKRNYIGTFESAKFQRGIRWR
ncbi:hypothetical protein P9181_17525 [Bacillus velezensis]|uniref:hypothetical protein n=1 Tax=Bacillus velezensis TaxID=492670 RepID=UPI002DBEE93D|nr:hypothetical protein [Bacillus velezensis]MEC3613129.1 hypothetical protein [Bacillus velezensis]MEC3677810.1 hypothetical protein [Bacillus velezensis]